MDLYSSTIINYHLDAIHGLMMENNNHMLRIFGNIENKLSASSKTIPEASAHPDVVVSLDNKWEPKEILAAEVDSDLDNGRSSPAEDSEVLIEIVETYNNEEEHLQSYACQVFPDIPSRKFDMKVEDSVKNHSVKHETKVFDEMIHTISAIVCDHSDFVMFDNQLALPCVLSACSHNQRLDKGIFDYLNGIDHAKLNLSLHQFTFDQFGLEFPFDPGSSSLSIFLRVARNYIFCSVLSDLGPDKFVMSILRNSCIEPLKLDLRNTVDAYEWVTTNCVGKNVLLRIVIGDKDPSFIASCEWSGVDIGLDFPYDPGSRFLTSYLGVADAKRGKLNDLHMLFVKSFIRKPLHCTRTGPSPRLQHVTILFYVKLLRIIGGSSKSKLLHDLYTLDFEMIVWSRTKMCGFHPSPIALGGFQITLLNEVAVLVQETNKLSGSRNSSLCKAAEILLYGNCWTSFWPAFQSINKVSYASDQDSRNGSMFLNVDVGFLGSYSQQDIVNSFPMYECDGIAIDFINVLTSGGFILMMQLLQGKIVVFASK